MMLQEFLQSHAGTFVLLMVSALAFYLTVMASIGIWRWNPKLIVIGELMIVLLVLVAWLIENLLATVLLAVVLIVSLVLILLAWYIRRRVKQQL